MRKTLLFLSAAAVAVACKTPAPQGSEVLSTPRANGNPVEQGPFVRNKCNAGGHEGPSAGEGWLFNPKEGCYLDCRDLNALKSDFLQQLKSHRVHGDPDVVAQVDVAGSNLMKRFHQNQAAAGLQMNSFKNLTMDQLYDGSKWKDYDIKPGDIFINMNFGQPNHAGIFYSKRGLAHARMVVEVRANEIVTFDGGWEVFSKLKQVNSQIVWLRPRAEYIKNGDIAAAVKWAKTMESSKYDNTLVDDWKEFRVVLHKLLDEGKSQVEARNAAFAWAKQNGKAPGSREESFSFKPPSGIYCSEGTAAIYSYLGYRQYGETAVDIMTQWGDGGDLPDWKLYADALSGFGASGDEKIYMMHKLFYNYFQVFDMGRKMGAIQVPGLQNSQGATFAQAVEANFKAVETDGGEGDHIQKQLDGFQAALTAQGGQAATVAQLNELKQGLVQAVGALSQASGKQLNLSQAVYTLFYANKAYGPHTFFENGKHFELKGVFYNSDVSATGGGQALFIANWYLQQVGQPMQRANIQTTLYRIKNDNALPADKCVVAEKAPSINAN